MSKIADMVSELARPIAEQFGCELWDVEYVREAGQWYLRVFIDRESGISIDDCEAVSRALDPILDEKDPIESNYIFEVSSAGLERNLHKPEHFLRFIGENVEVKLYTQVEGAKQYSGTLTAFDKGAVTIDSNGVVRVFTKDQVANVRLSLI
ncbi:MAG: ribosome maturation factor RimP [Oscillospiraceae bacterium]